MPEPLFILLIALIVLHLVLGPVEGRVADPEIMGLGDGVGGMAGAVEHTALYEHPGQGLLAGVHLLGPLPLLLSPGICERLEGLDAEVFLAQARNGDYLAVLHERAAVLA